MTNNSPSKSNEMARACLVTYLDPGPHDNLVTVWRIETIAKIKEALTQAISEEREKIRDLVLDDVPHQYQSRLLEALK